MLPSDSPTMIEQDEVRSSVDAVVDYSGTPVMENETNGDNLVFSASRSGTITPDHDLDAMKQRW